MIIRTSQALVKAVGPIAFLFGFAVDLNHMLNILGESFAMAWSFISDPYRKVSVKLLKGDKTFELIDGQWVEIDA